MGSWSSLRVVSSLLKDARGAGDKVWVGRYFLARQAIFGQRPLAWLGPKPQALSWHSSPTRLAVSMQSGGLASWYEISHQRAYVPTPSFEPRPGWNVVDVGANIGAFAIWAAAAMGRSGRIIAIEPNPISFERLERSLQELDTSAVAVQVACGETDGEATLYFQPGYTVSSSLMSFDAGSEVWTVRVRRLDDLLREHEVTHVDLLKIDVEGVEEMVLRGGGDMLSRIDRVVLETTSGPVDVGVRQILGAAGFSLVHEAADNWGIDGLELLAFERPQRRRRLPDHR